MSQDLKNKIKTANGDGGRVKEEDSFGVLLVCFFCIKNRGSEEREREGKTERERDREGNQGKIEAYQNVTRVRCCCCVYVI